MEAGRAQVEEVNCVISVPLRTYTLIYSSGSASTHYERDKKTYFMTGS